MMIHPIRTLKRFFHRKKIAKLLTKNYYPFDIIDDIPNVIFILFKDFYENGQLEIINWDSDEYHKKARKSMDIIYKYITKRRLKFEDYMKQNDYNDLFEIEEFKMIVDDYYCKKIIDMRGYLWT